jgi:hypothetical protein
VVGVADPLDATLGCRDDLLEGVTGEVGQLHAFEAGPQRLDRVELGRVARPTAGSPLPAEEAAQLGQAPIRVSLL